MTDFTGEEMRTIILRSLNANAARMRRKLKRQAARAAAKAAAASPRAGHDETAALPVTARGRSGE